MCLCPSKLQIPLFISIYTSIKYIKLSIFRVKKQALIRNSKNLKKIDSRDFSAFLCELQKWRRKEINLFVTFSIDCSVTNRNDTVLHCTVTLGEARKVGILLMLGKFSVDAVIPAGSCWQICYCSLICKAAVFFALAVLA